METFIIVQFVLNCIGIVAYLIKINSGDPIIEVDARLSLCFAILWVVWGACLLF